MGLAGRVDRMGRVCVWGESGTVYPPFPQSGRVRVEVSSVVDKRQKFHQRKSSHEYLGERVENIMIKSVEAIKSHLSIMLSLILVSVARKTVRIRY